MKTKTIYLLILVLMFSSCTNNILTVDDDSKSSKPTSPLGLKLEAINNVGVLELTATVSLIEGISEGAKGTSLEIKIPEQFEIIEGKPGFSQMDINSGETVTTTIKLRAVKDGEGVIDANVINDESIQGFLNGDNEKIYTFVTGDKIRIKDSPFTNSSSLESQTERID